MQDIKHREQKIKEKRKQTPWRDFLKEIVSRVPLNIYKFNGKISRYPQTERIPHLLEANIYEEERSLFTNNFQEYNSEISFFDNLKILFNKTPYPARITDMKTENSDFAEAVWKSKNAYLSFLVIGDCENILYSFYTQDHVRNVFNSVFVRDSCDNIYQSSGIIKSYNIFYSKYIVNSSNIWFSSNLIGCTECICCDNLDNQSYYINNQRFSKEEYLLRKTEILKDPLRFNSLYANINNNGENFNSKNVLGQFCTDSNNLENALFAYRVDTGRNLVFVGEKNGRKNVFDTFCSDGAGIGDIYGCSNLGSVQNVYCSDCLIGESLYYCFNCLHCSYCLGCSGLLNKQFCILNKQYDKEERFEKANEIFAQMYEEGILGEIFPGKMNPLYFNDTAAYLIDDSFTKEEVEAQGYLWRDEPIRVDISQSAEVITTHQLNDYQGYNEQNNWKINPDILKKVIKDDKGNYYRIVPMELEFLQKYGLPLPEIHWLDRIKLGFKFK